MRGLLKRLAEKKSLFSKPGLFSSSPIYNVFFLVEPFDLPCRFARRYDIKTLIYSDPYRRFLNFTDA